MEFQEFQQRKSQDEAVSYFFNTQIGQVGLSFRAAGCFMPRTTAFALVLPKLIETSFVI